MEDKSKCWWCGKNADSREHIIKKSDFKRVYGTPSCQEEIQPLIEVGPNKIFKIQGPNSKLIKFKANLCQDCNNSRSSEFDMSYDKFIKEIQPLFKKLLKEKVLDLCRIYGKDWKNNFLNLTKYYLKHIGCRLNHEEVEVPQNLIDFLNGNRFLQDVKLQFEVRPLNYIFAQTSKEVFQETKQFEILHLGRSQIRTLNTDRNIQQAYFSWITTGWMSINYIVEKGISSENYFVNNLKSKIPISVANIELPNQFDKIGSIDEKARWIEEFDRINTLDIREKFYNRIKTA